MTDRSDPEDPLFLSEEWLQDNARVNRLLVEHFPELRDVYEDEIVAEGWETEGPMVVYGFIFHPFLEAALLDELADSTLIERIFRFLRILENDPNQPDTVTVGVADFIASDPRLLTRALPHLGPRMREAVRST